MQPFHSDAKRYPGQDSQPIICFGNLIWQTRQTHLGQYNWDSIACSISDIDKDYSTERDNGTLMYWYIVLVLTDVSGLSGL